LLGPVGQMLGGGAGQWQSPAPTVVDCPPTGPEHEPAAVPRHPRHPATGCPVDGARLDRADGHLEPRRRRARSLVDVGHHGLRSGRRLDQRLQGFNPGRRLFSKPDERGLEVPDALAVLGLEVPDALAVLGLGPAPLLTQLLLALLETVDGSLALVGVPLGHGPVEDEPTHPSFVGRELLGQRCTGIAAQPGVERPQGGAGARVAQADADRVVAQI